MKNDVLNEIRQQFLPYCCEISRSSEPRDWLTEGHLCVRSAENQPG